MLFLLLFFNCFFLFFFCCFCLCCCFGLCVVVVVVSCCCPSECVHVQNLMQMIENHPQRQALHIDLIKKNIEVCEVLDVEPKAQCKVCLSYWDVGIVFYTRAVTSYEMMRQRTRSHF